MILTVSLNVESRESAEKPADNVKPEHVYDVPSGVTLYPKTEKGYQAVFKPEQEYKCFTAKEYQTIAHIIIDYRWFWVYATNLELQLGLKTKEVTNLGQQMQLWKEKYTLMSGEKDFLGGLFDAEHEQRLLLEREKKTELWIWRIATGVVVVLATAGWTAYGVGK